MSDKTRYDVMTVREYMVGTETRNAWTKIGAAFVNKGGSIGVQLDALPIDGKLILQIPLTEEELEKKRAERDQNRGGSRGGNGRTTNNSGYNNNQGGGSRGGFQGRAQQRGRSEPQRSFPEQLPQDDDGSNDAPREDLGNPGWTGSGWRINGKMITDERELPQDHPKYIPF